MKYSLTLLSIIILSFLTCFSQNEGIKITGKISDAETGNPLTSVNIVLRGSTVGTTSDKDGNFRIILYKTPVILRFSMVGYKSYYLKIHEYKDQNIDIHLEPRITDLPLATIYADKIVNITKDERLYVADYEFYKNNILLLAYKEKIISKPYIIFMTPEGDTLCSRIIKKAEELYRDGLDYTHLVTRNFCYQIEIDSGCIDFYFPTPKEDFFNMVSHLDDATDALVFVHQYYNRNQVLLYIDFNRTDSTYSEFRTITDEQGMIMLFDNDRWGLFGARNEHEARFEEMCFADPIFAPLFLLDDSIYIINFVNSQIEIYDIEGKELDIIPIEFNNYKNIREKIIVDDVSKKVYALFKKGAITTLREINLKTGQLTSSIHIPEYPFIENIKVRDDVVYFLYKERINEEYKQLYKLNLN